MKKNKSLIIVIVVVLVIVLALLLGFMLEKKGSKLKTNVDKTQIGETSGYRLDLRIYGKYNNTNINEIIIVNNYKNSDKNITFTKVNEGEEVKREFVVKEGKYYELKENKLESIENILYENTDIFLNGVKNIKDVKSVDSKTIGEETYKVYTGTVSKEVINEMLEYTDLGFKVDSDASCEVWLTNEGYIYRAYYKVDDLTIYPSYFGYNKTTEINLDIYK